MAPRLHLRPWQPLSSKDSEEDHSAINSNSSSCAGYCMILRVTDMVAPVAGAGPEPSISGLLYMGQSRFLIGPEVLRLLVWARLAHEQIPKPNSVNSVRELYKFRYDCVYVLHHEGHNIKERKIEQESCGSCQ
ncbi:hypothetical protein CDL15_Pgr022893 [Punica granatum]|uniref:Uncharacterized protein n=1 Tax=Punica granatum TaxID=22663 RepID=A0A218X4R5_PUNGR|nr:hypothetical protein CDL15_Pgr022893 [Punica granatum]